MLFMVIERLKNRDAKAVYRRFRDQGRMAPDGPSYVDSWVETEQWAAHWQDLVAFEFVPVLRSKEAIEIITPGL